MTIVVGILATDGVLIAADSQETYPAAKLDQGKVRGSIHMGTTGTRMVLVAGAGDGHYCDAFAQQLEGPTLDDRRFNDDGGPRLVLQEVIEAFYARHVLPFSRYGPHERPDIDTLIGYATPESAQLFSSNGNALVQHNHVAAIGAGAPWAKMLLQRFLPSGLQMTLADAAMLAIYVLYQVKDSVESCGKRTDILAVREKSFVRVRPIAIAEIEDAVRGYGRTERGVMQFVLGGAVADPSALVASDRAKFLQLRDRLGLSGPVGPVFASAPSE